MYFVMLEHALVSFKKGKCYMRHGDVFITENEVEWGHSEVMRITKRFKSMMFDL